MNKLPKKNNQNEGVEVTSQSNTIDAIRENGGGKTPGNKASKRSKNKLAEPKKGKQQEVKKGSSTNKIFEL